MNQGIQIAPSRDHFIRNGKPYFYCADTLWSAFTNVSIPEWKDYLSIRSKQGFNALQMNILPQWDRSKKADKLYPFDVEADGKIHFNRINKEYFDHCCSMLEMSSEKGFVPALVVLWNDWLNGTWASKRAPGHEMPVEAVKDFVSFVTDTFARFQPIYFVSGDTGFDSEDANAAYLIALETIKTRTPEALTCLHIKPKVELPEIFVKSPHLDFYVYQSGHMLDSQHLAYGLTQQFLNAPVKRPILNSEPCYEAHGHGRKYGRYREFDIRKATWQSLLAGAKAGIGYGAHGVWQWHETGDFFPGEAFSSTPYTWKSGMHLPGAWDVTFARWLFETHGLHDVQPIALAEGISPEIKAAASSDKSRFAIYLPFSAKVSIDLCLNDHEFILIDLEERRFSRPQINFEGEKTIFEMHEYNADVLILGIKK